MRLGVFLAFFVIALATASPPAVAQLSPPPLPDVEKPDKEAKKPDKEAKKPDKGGGESGPGDVEEGGPGDDDEGGPGDDDEGGPGEEEGGNDEEGETGGGSGGGGSGDRSGQDPAGAERPTNGPGSADQGRRSSLLSEAGCPPEECGLLEDPTDGGEEDAILTAAGGSRVTGGGVVSLGSVDGASAFQDEGALSTSAAPDAGPAVLALFALMVLGLLVGLAGGLSALHGRLRGG